MENKYYVSEHRKKIKQRAVESFRNKCSICGYDKCIAALEFHHLDPNQKEIGISGKTSSWIKIAEELRKCIMVCSNCHREIHSGETSVPQNVIRFDESFSKWASRKPKKKICSVCSKKYTGTNKKYCSSICQKKKRTERYPSPEILLEEVNSSNYTAVGKKYGVSDNAIRKYLKNNLP